MAQFSFESLSLKNETPVWTLTINRPTAMNALNSQVLKELSQVLDIVSESQFSDCRCLVITGSGEKAFVAGADIKELADLDADAGKKFAELGQKLFRRFEDLKVPAIAAVNGFCLGGGLELALACDFIFASENARLGLPEVTLGLIPGFGGTVRLSRRVGMSRAKEMIFSGDFVGAAEAQQIGLVNKVFPLADLMPAVLKVANTIASRGTVAVWKAKQSILTAFDQTLDEGMRTESNQFSQLFSTQDFKEGTQAFVEKRKPVFKGH